MIKDGQQINTTAHNISVFEF